MEEKKSTKMELVIALNENIVIQRDVSIFNFDNKAKNSIECLEFMDNFKDFVMTHLARKSSDYMIEYRNEIINSDKFLYNYDNDGEECFNIYLKKNGVTVSHRQFSAKLFPAVVRYNLDVRPFMKSVKEDIIDIFTYNKKRELTYDYLGYSTI